MRITSRPSRFRGALLLAIPGLLAGALGGVVYENGTEFSATGDCDGDGRTDVVIVDRTSGTYRIGYQLSPGVFTWAAPRAGGVDDVTAMGIGRVLDSGRDALVLASPTGNRLNVFAVGDPATAALPQTFFPPGIGPGLVVCLDIGGAGNTPLDDFLAATVLNDGGASRLEALRNSGPGVLLSLGLGSPGGVPRRGNRVVLKTGQQPVAVMLVRNGATDRFQAYQLSAGTLGLLVDVPLGPASDLDYAYGFFGPGPLGQFLFYTRGQNAVAVRRVTEPTPGVFSLGTPVAYGLGNPIHQVFVVEGGTASRWLVVFGNGTNARVYDFDGANAPVAGAAFNAAAGEEFTGAAALENGGLMLLRGPAGSGVTSGFARYGANGSAYVLQGSGDLPAISALSRRANVMTFQFEPFVAPAPNLLQSFNAGDWAALYLPQAPGQATVTYESYLNPTAGLGAATTQTLSPISASAGFALVNQYRDSLSLFRLGPAVGGEIVDVTVQPAPGTYPTSVQVSFKTADPQAMVRYRTSGSDNWTTFTQPFWVFKDTTIWFYATPNPSGTALKSAIRQASYRFTANPAALDSDGDGVPDYVEIANGLDPVESGSDGDGDGYADLQELTQGTDPTDPLDYPASPASRPDLHAVVDLIQAPQAVDGVSGAAVDGASGTVLRATDAVGNLLAVGSAAPLGLPGLNGPAAVLSNVVVDLDLPWVVAATEPHFDIVTAQSDKRIGRELIHLLDLRDHAHPITLPQTWSGGGLAAEAADWTTGASNRLATAERQQVMGNFNATDTLAALLIEEKIRDILLARGRPEFGDLTLFPWRAGDAGRSRLSFAEFAALRQQTADGHPGFRLDAALGLVNAALSAMPPNDPAGSLKALAWEIFRVSSASNNPPAGVAAWPFYASPVDTLRGFLRSGEVASNYLSASGSLAGLAPAAFAQSQTLLNGISGRPVVDLDLKIRADTFAGGCVRLDTLNGAQTWALVSALGGPFEFIDSFTLPVGSIVRVLGYADVADPGCPGPALEVISAELITAPLVSGEDSDGDLLPDTLELALFGDLSQNGFGDNDGDGILNLQELLDGTDPADGGSKGLPVANFSLPAVQLQLGTAGQVKLLWQWPTAYAGQVQFGVLGAPDLGGTFNQLPAVQTYLGNDTFELAPPNPGGQTFFYQLFMSRP